MNSDCGVRKGGKRENHCIHAKRNAVIMLWSRVQYTIDEMCAGYWKFYDLLVIAATQIHNCICTAAAATAVARRCLVVGKTVTFMISIVTNKVHLNEIMHSASYRSFHTHTHINTVHSQYFFVRTRIYYFILRKRITKIIVLHKFKIKVADQNVSNKFVWMANSGRRRKQNEPLENTRISNLKRNNSNVFTAHRNKKQNFFTILF